MPGVEAVEDLTDPRLADYRNVPDADLRVRRDVFIAESRLVVRRLLQAGRFPTRSVLLTGPALDELRDVVPSATRVFVASHAVIKGVVGFDFHRGCLAVGERREWPLDLGAARLVVVLERVANPDNVGGVFRNAMAFGADAVLLSPGCADPLYRKAIRVSMGGSLQVPFGWATEWPADVVRLREAGFAVVALTPSGDAEDIATLRALPARVALVLGTEGEGLSDDVLGLADVRIGIRMAGGIDSLNVAAAAAIALHRVTSACRLP